MITNDKQCRNVTIIHDGKQMYCEGYYNEWSNEYDCRYETQLPYNWYRVFETA